MASYIPNVTDYIPQIQTFKPDLNYYSNILQNKQNKYDANKAQLSGLYGSLFYSPMLRDSNIQRRDDFFKAIDGDIKKISGMDLSLEQNVDAASKIFEPLIEDKFIRADMVYTKNYLDEVDRGEAFRYCEDPNKCGGQYWEDGINALHYQADEFKKASDDDSLKFSAPKFTPYINVTEKAIKFAKDMGFSVSSVTSDGKYLITTKNGNQIKLPLAQLYVSMYGNDQSVMDMFNTQAYLQRKNFIFANAGKYGSEDKAEEQYFNKVLNGVGKTTLEESSNVTKAVDNTKLSKSAMENKIRRVGVLADDPLFKAYTNADQEVQIAEGVKQVYDKATGTIKSVPNIASDRRALRNKVDSIMANGFLQVESAKAADIYGNLNSDVKYEVDPYAKSYYDYSLDLQKMAAQYNLDISKAEELAKIDIRKQMALGKVTTAGSAMSNIPKPITDPTVTADMSTGGGDLQKELQTFINTQASQTEGYASEYVDQTVNFLKGIINSNVYSEAEKSKARQDLQSIFGDNYDPDSGNFISTNSSGGKKQTTDWKLTGDDPRGLYKNANNVIKSNKGLYNEFNTNTLQSIEEAYNRQADLWNSASKIWFNNNALIREYAYKDASIEDKDKFDLLFESNNDIKTSKEYIKDYVDKYYDKEKQLSDKSSKTQTWHDAIKRMALESFKSASGDYKRLYNSGQVKNGQGKAITAPFTTAATIGIADGGKTAQAAMQFEFDQSRPANTGTQGLLSFVRDAIDNKAATRILNRDNNLTKTEYNNLGEKEPDQDAINLITAMLDDMQSGKYATESDLNKRPKGKFIYKDISANNKDIASIWIQPDEDWLKSKKDGTSNGKDLIYGKTIDAWRKGVSIYVDKNKANNDLVNLFKASPTDIKLNAGPITISRENAGSLTVTKDPTTGDIIVQGQIFGLDENGKQIHTLSKIYRDVNTETLLKTITDRVNEVNKLNTDYQLNGKQKQRIFNPEDVLKNINPNSNQQVDPLGVFNSR